MSQIESIYSPQVEKQLQQIYSELEKHQKKVLELSKMSVDFYGGKTASSPKGLNETINKLEKLKKVSVEVSKSARQMELASIKESNARNALNKQRETSIAQQERENAKLIESERAYVKLSKAENIAAKQLQDLIARGKLATQTQAQYNAELARAKANFDLLRAKLIMADNATGRWSRTNERSIVGIKRLGTGVRQLMSAFGVFSGIYMFSQVIIGAFNTIRDFDKANIDLAATMGKTANEIKALTEDAKRLGGITKFTASEVSKLQKEFAKLGFSEQEILNATEYTLQLAAAVGTDLENAAEVAGATLRGFNLEASEMERVANVMGASFTKSALDIDNFRESMKYVAPIAANSGVSIEFATAMLSKLADAGIKGSQAGTSLRRILTEMAKTGKPTAEAFEMIAKNGINVKDAMDEVGRTAQTSLLVLAKNKNEVLALNDAYHNVAGTIDKMANEQLKSLDGQITLLTSAWDGFILSLNKGDGLLSNFFKGVISQMTTFVNALNDFNKTSAEKAKGFATTTYKETINELENYSKKQIELRKRGEITEEQYNERVERLNKQRAAELLKNAEKNLNILGWEAQEKLLILEEEKRNADNFLNKSTKVATGGLLSNMTNRQALEDAEKEYQASLNAVEHLKEKIRAYTDVLNPNTKAIQENAKAIEDSDEKKKKSAKELEKVETNSKIAFQRQISALQHQIDKTNIASAEYSVLTFQLKLLKGAYDALYGSQEKVNELTFGTIPYYENEIKLLREKQDLVTRPEQYEQLEKNVKFYEDLIKWIKGVKDETDKAKDATKEWLDEYRKTFQDDFISASGFDKIFFLIENFDKLKTSGVDTALAISEAFQQAFNTISEASLSNFDNEYSRLEQQKELSLKFAGESASAREEIERQSEVKRKEIARREAEAQKRLAMFNIAINTAQAIIATLAKTPPPAGIPLAIAMGAIGAVQLGLVASQQIPQFWKGTENAPEGYAWTQEKGAEIITDKKGKVKTYGNDKGAQLTYLEKGDKVFTAEKTKGYLNGILQNVGISPIGSYANVQSQQNAPDFTNLENKISNLASAIKNQDKTVITVYKDKTFTRVGGKELQNARLEIRPRKYTNG